MIVYPQATGKQLYDFALTQLGIELKRIIELSSEMGQIELLKHIKKTNRKEFRKETFGIIWHANQTSQLPTLYWLSQSMSWFRSVLFLDSTNSGYLNGSIHNAFKVFIKDGNLNGLEQFQQTLKPTLIDRVIGRFLGQGNKPTPETLKRLIKKEKFFAVRVAWKYGQLEVLKWLKEQFNEEWDSMLKIGQGYISELIVSGHLDALKWLEQETASYWFARWFKDRITTSAFDQAYRNRHFETCLWLLKYPHILSFAQAHHEEYDMVSTFIDDFIIRLYEAKRLFMVENPDGVFDLNDPQQIKQCFYILRDLIRRYPTGPATLRNDFLFLLEIPSVKAMAHRSVTAGQSNDLLRLAQSVGNLRACSVLLNIPAVRNLAVQNNYYRNEAHGALDLRGLVDDNESSMKMLTTGEQKRLANLLEDYAPQVKDVGGVSAVMDDLRHTLSKRYSQNPAKCLFDDGIEQALPEEYSDFMALDLSVKERQRALDAYYQHKDHAALRYISKPNRWMHPKASYVYINDERTERWSTFEDYQSLIANFYLAAIDKNIPATDGHTLEGRLTQFIDELAHLGRAHNWDGYQNKLDKNGMIQFGANGEVIKEQYDDLTGDKPSCLSGVKRRIFQSVVGHPSVTLLTQDIIQQLLIDQVRAHYKSVLTHNHKATIAVVLDCLTEGEAIPETEYHELTAINLNQDFLDAFFLDLEKKYGETASDFFPGIRQQFDLPENNDDPKFRHTHFLAFYLKARLADLVSKPMKESVATNGFFAKSSENLPLSEIDDPDFCSEFHSAELDASVG